MAARSDGSLGSLAASAAMPPSAADTALSHAKQPAESLSQLRTSRQASLSGSNSPRGPSTEAQMRSKRVKVLEGQLQRLEGELHDAHEMRQAAEDSGDPQLLQEFTAAEQQLEELVKQMTAELHKLRAANREAAHALRERLRKMKEVQAHARVLLTSGEDWANMEDGPSTPTTPTALTAPRLAEAAREYTSEQSASDSPMLQPAPQQPNAPAAPTSQRSSEPGPSSSETGSPSSRDGERASSLWHTGSSWHSRPSHQGGPSAGDARAGTPSPEALREGHRAGVRDYGQRELVSHDVPLSQPGSSRPPSPAGSAASGGGGPSLPAETGQPQQPQQQQQPSRLHASSGSTPGGREDNGQLSGASERQSDAGLGAATVPVGTVRWDALPQSAHAEGPDYQPPAKLQTAFSGHAFSGSSRDDDADAVGVGHSAASRGGSESGSLKEAVVQAGQRAGGLRVDVSETPKEAQDPFEELSNSRRGTADTLPSASTDPASPSSTRPLPSGLSGNPFSPAPSPKALPSGSEPPPPWQQQPPQPQPPASFALPLPPQPPPPPGAMDRLPSTNPFAAAPPAPLQRLQSGGPSGIITQWLASEEGYTPQAAGTGGGYPLHPALLSAPYSAGMPVSAGLHTVAGFPAHDAYAVVTQGITSAGYPYYAPAATHTAFAGAGGAYAPQPRPSSPPPQPVTSIMYQPLPEHVPTSHAPAALQAQHFPAAAFYSQPHQQPLPPQQPEYYHHQAAAASAAAGGGMGGGHSLQHAHSQEEDFSLRRTASGTRRTSASRVADSSPLRREGSLTRQGSSSGSGLLSRSQSQPEWLLRAASGGLARTASTGLPRSGSGLLRAGSGGSAASQPASGRPSVVYGWKPLSVEDRVQCERAYDKKGYAAHGGVSKAGAQQLFLRAGIVGQFSVAWAIVDRSRTGRLDKREFCLLMYLAKALKRGVLLPSKLGGEEWDYLLGLRPAAGPAIPAAGGAAGGGGLERRNSGTAGLEQVQKPDEVAHLASKPPTAAKQRSPRTTAPEDGPSAAPVPPPHRSSSKHSSGEASPRDPAAARAPPIPATPLAHKPRTPMADVSPSSTDAAKPEASASSSPSSADAPSSGARSQDAAAAPPPPAAAERAGPTHRPRELRESASDVRDDPERLALSVSQVKLSYRKPLDRPFFLVSLRDSGGRLLEPAQETPPGVYLRSEGVIRLDHVVRLTTAVRSLPPGATLFLEIRHWKVREKRFSLLAWAFAPLEALVAGQSQGREPRVRAGALRLQLYAKPLEVKGGLPRRLKPYSGDMHLSLRAV